MANICSHDFNLADSTLLRDVSGWAKIYGITGDLRVFDGMVSNRSAAGPGAAGFQCSLGTPPSADYEVSCDLVVKSVISDCYVGVAGRIQSGATTFYQFYHNGTTNEWAVSKRIADTNTVLGTVASGVSAGNTYRIKLKMDGNQISGYVNGALVLGPFTNSEITGAGLPGIRRLDNTNSTSTTGVHYDNFSADTLTAAATNVTASNATQSNTVSSGAILSVLTGTLTTAPLKNNAGALLANETGATAFVHNVATGALVVMKTGQTTNASGVMTINDAAIVPGTLYRVIVKLASAAEGLDKLTAT